MSSQPDINLDFLPTGFAIQLLNINELSRNDLKQLVTNEGVNMINVSATKMNNIELLDAMKQIKNLGCKVRAVLEESDMIQHFSRIGFHEQNQEDIEETQVRRICTIAKQVNVAVIISNVAHNASLEVIKEFTKNGFEVFAEISSTTQISLVNFIQRNKAIHDFVIMAPKRNVIDLSCHVKMSCINPAKILGFHGTRGTIAIGSNADITVWRKDNFEGNDNDNAMDYKSGFKVNYAIVNGHVVMTPDKVNPGCFGQVVEFKGLKNVVEEGVKHVEREKINDSGDKAHQKITIDAAGVTSLDKVPRIFQRRVSAFGVRNQQDSSFSLSNTDADEDPEMQHHSLTGSRRASVKVHAPPGGLSSGFW